MRQELVGVAGLKQSIVDRLAKPKTKKKQPQSVPPGDVQPVSEIASGEAPQSPKEP